MLSRLQLMAFLAPPPSYENLSVANAPYSVATSSEIPGLDVVEPPFISLDVIEGMLDAPSNIDWVSSNDSGSQLFSTQV